MTSPASTNSSARRWLGYIAIGLGAGFLSGLFGIGGGAIIVPGLVALVGMDIRRAAGTSLLAIVPVSLAGVATYGLGGHVDLLLAALLAGGSILGAQFGSWLLSRISRIALTWGFIAFLAATAISLFLVVPSRDAVLEIGLVNGAGLAGLGFVAGVLAGLLGIGGGMVIVPALVLVFGSSDLVAKGSSLLMIIATSLSGTISNIVRKNVDVPAAVVVGASAVVTTSLGALVAAWLPPLVANILFAIYLLIMGARMALAALRQRQAGRD